MEITILIAYLNSRLTEYKKTDVYFTKELKQDILSIEIAVCLFEMALYCNREISEEEKHWFAGGYYISTDVTGEWSDISSKYDEVVKIAKEKKII